jgi:GNAT superfamily N-acetyltransferase
MPVIESPTTAEPDGEITIEPLRAEDLDEADRVVRLAFGTFLGIPEPQMFEGEAECARTRWTANPSHAFAARSRSSGELVGSVFATNWGSVGFFGPLTVHPDYWDRGVGKRLMEPVVALFDRWGTRCAGLYTFAHSQKHIALYQRFGFWPRFLTMIMTRPVMESGDDRPDQASLFSDLDAGDRGQCLDNCRALCQAIYDGLDVSGEIESVEAQSLGDTVLLWDGDRLDGLAICHMGPGSEAGTGTCYVKFGAVRPGPTAGAALERLLDACAELCGSNGALRLLTGVNTARHEAYRILLARGFRTEYQGVTMHRHNEPGYNRPGVYLLDDWR